MKGQRRHEGGTKERTKEGQMTDERGTENKKKKKYRLLPIFYNTFLNSAHKEEDQRRDG